MRGVKPQKGDRVMRDLIELPWYIPELIVGFEDGDGDDGDGDDSDDDDADNDDDSDDDDDADDQGDKPVTKADLAAVQEALRKERQDRRRLAKELRQEKRANAQKQRRDSEDKSEAETAREEAAGERVKNEKLASSLLTSGVNQAITTAATKMKFRDLDDALALVDRDLIDADQDDEDPTEIDIDSDSVVAALKKLAEKKPHLLLGDGDEDPSGSKFGGRRDSKNKKTDEAALAEKFPALARRGIGQ